MRRLCTLRGVVTTMFAFSLIVAVPASAQAAVGILANVPGGIIEIPEAPDEVMEIDLVAMAGSGCRPGTADVAIAPDNTAFTVIYSDYLAAAGPGVPFTERRKNCQLNVNVAVPPGFTYAILKVDHRGYALLDDGASALQRANYYFQGMTQGAYAAHPLVGPLDDNWIASDEVPLAALVWRPCGDSRNLNINTELRVNPGSSDDVSFATMDSTDGSIQTTYHLQWGICPSGA